MTREPVQATTPPDDLPFPFDIRALLAGWKLPFFRSAAFHPDSARSTDWNCGAYLAQGLAHCGACDTPRNFLGAEKSGRALEGGYAQGWHAYALDEASPAPEPWTADAIYAYLHHGWQAQHGVALGRMGEVTHDLAIAPDQDVRAIAIYVASLIGTPPPAAPSDSEGEVLYRGACASCHEGGRGPPFSGIGLALSSALHAPDPTNVANVVVEGIPSIGEERAPIMPGFGAVLTDQKILDLLTYLRARFGAPQPWDGIPQAVQAACDTTALLKATQ